VVYAEDESMFVESTDLNSGEPLFLSSPEDTTRARLVAIINKSKIGSTAQTMKVYLDGQLVYEWKVSTGREKLETAKSGRTYVTATPVGYFRPQRVTALHRSITWQADMPHAVFFNGGIAIHASNAVQALGTRASGGCVRLSPQNAKLFFDLVKQAGINSVEKISVSGKSTKNADGSLAQIKTYDTLIIVENRI
jgi:hypothetical protein